MRQRNFVLEIIHALFLSMQSFVCFFFPCQARAFFDHLKHILSVKCLVYDYSQFLRRISCNSSQAVWITETFVLALNDLKYNNNDDMETYWYGEKETLFKDHFYRPYINSKVVE